MVTKHVKIDHLHSLLWRSTTNCDIIMPLQPVKYAELWSSNQEDNDDRVCNFCPDSATICRHTFIRQIGILKWTAISHFDFSRLIDNRQ